MPDQGVATSGSAADDLRAAFAEVSDEKPAAPETAADPAPAEPAAAGGEADTSSPEAGQAAGPSRDERGRFASKAPGSAEEELAVGDQVSEQPAGVVEAPAGWSAAEKDAFGKAPPEIREAFLRRDREREADYTRKTQELSQERQFYGQMRPVMEGIHADLQATGTNVPIGAWIANAHEWHRVLGNPQTRVPAFRQLAQTYGIDLTGTAVGGQPAAQPAGQDDTADPIVAQMRLDLAERDRRIAALEQNFGQVNGHLQTEAQQRQHQAQQQLQTRIDAFRDAKDALGAPKHPHFEVVRQHMAILMGGDQAKTLDEAYDQAVYANPTTRQTLLAAQQRAADEQRTAQARTVAEKAKRAGSSVSGSPTGGPTVKPPNASARDDLAEAFYGRA